MADLVQHPVIQALAWALVHFVWQGAVIGLVAFVAFRFGRTASLRYAIGVGALVAALAAPVGTFLTFVDSPAQAVSTGATRSSELGAVSVPPESSTPEAGLPSTGTALGLGPDALGLAVVGWMFGVAFFSVRLLGGWVVARRMARQAVRPAAMHIQAMAAGVAERLALKRAVAVLESSAVVVPVMVGWLKPAIVLPVAALAGLTPRQVEALLAHELAHVRRHDYLVNLLQSAAEALLFFHPVVWWLSRRVRAERELCCDDLAVGVCDRLVYATALTDLAAMTSPHVALAATDGDLLGRVRRILGHADQHPAGRAGWMSVFALALVAGLGVPVVMASAAQAPATALEDVLVPPVSHLTIDADGRVSAQGQVGARMQAGEPLEIMAGPLTFTVQTAAQQAEQRRREELRRQIEELVKELAKIETARAADVKAKIADEHKKVLEQALRGHEAQIEAARRQMDEARKHFETGLVSQSHLREVEAALAKAQAHGNVEAKVEAELKDAQAKLERSRALFEKGLLSSSQVVDVEAMVRALSQQAREKHLATEEVAKRMHDIQAQVKKATEANAIALHDKLIAQRAAREVVEATLQDRVKMLTEQVQKFDRLAHELEVQRGTEIGATEPVKAGDVLRVAIDGEPDLPTNYTVRPDGTIRLPFVGSIKVAGLNAVQARDAIGKQLADRKLGSASQVKVSVVRAKLVTVKPIKLERVTIKVAEPVKKDVKVEVKKGK